MRSNKLEPRTPFRLRIKERNDKIKSGIEAGVPYKIIAQENGCTFNCVAMVAKRNNLRRSHIAINSGDELNALRNELGLSISELARQLGISDKLLEQWIYGRGVPMPMRRIVYLAMSHLKTRPHVRKPAAAE